MAADQQAEIVSRAGHEELLLPLAGVDLGVDPEGADHPLDELADAVLELVLVFARRLRLANRRGGGCMGAVATTRAGV